MFQSKENPFLLLLFFSLDLDRSFYHINSTIFTVTLTVLHTGFYLSCHCSIIGLQHHNIITLNFFNTIVHLIHFLQTMAYLIHFIY